jgi:hypothetical protein
MLFLLSTSCSFTENNHEDSNSEKLKKQKQLLQNNDQNEKSPEENRTRPKLLKRRTKARSKGSEEADQEGKGQMTSGFLRSQKLRKRIADKERENGIGEQEEGENTGPGDNEKKKKRRKGKGKGKGKKKRGTEKSDVENVETVENDDGRAE